MKRFLKILIIIFSVILIKLVLFTVLNETIKVNFHNGVYNSKLIKVLYFLNVNESYIVYYNDGNLLYKKNNYDEAIKKYDESLKRKPPKKRVCDIRINKSLAMVNRIKSKDNKTIYDELEKAKENLYEDGCANKEDDNGESEKAEGLEKEIQKLQDELDNSSSSDDSDDQNQTDNSENENDDTKYVEQDLKEIQKEASQSREEDMKNSEYIGNFKYYSGKRW